VVISTKIRGAERVAVFTRNHQRHIDEAIAISSGDPNKHIVFRARSKWVSAADALVGKTPLPLYIAPVGGDGTVEYVADLHDIHLHPEYGDGRTDQLLALTTASTQGEGLWENKEHPVETLYVITNCRRIQRPFHMTKLVKVSDDKPISSDYGYSYSIVYAADEDAVAAPLA
jgi:hypothetical protein